jgi:hypothetical protein
VNFRTIFCIIYDVQYVRNISSVGKFSKQVRSTEIFSLMFLFSFVRLVIWKLSGPNECVICVDYFRKK